MKKGLGWGTIADRVAETVGDWIGGCVMVVKPRKKAGKPVGQPHELDEMNEGGSGNAELEVGEGVAVRMRSGVAYFWPATFDRLPAESRELATELMVLAGQRRALGREIDGLADHMHSSCGFSWGQIGWCLGMSADGARKRWRENDPTNEGD